MLVLALLADDLLIHFTGCLPEYYAQLDRGPGKHGMKAGHCSSHTVGTCTGGATVSDWLQ